jgi:hypothetical protein
MLSEASRVSVERFMICIHYIKDHWNRISNEIREDETVNINLVL